MVEAELATYIVEKGKPLLRWPSDVTMPAPQRIRPIQ